jgi:hypothetical protein
MKKITLLLSFFLCVVLANAQNLVTNPGFETWSAGAPSNWTITASTAPTVVQSTTTPSSTGSALQITGAATTSLTQLIPAPAGGFDVTKLYKVSFKYKATAGDGTDARIWSNWVTSAIGATTTLYTKMTLTDSLALKGPGGNNQPASGVVGTGTNGYLIDNRSGDWLTYSYSFTPPAGVTQFSLQLRTYTGATVIWDDVYFGVDPNAAVVTPSADILNVSVAGKKLTISNSPSTSVEIFNVAGAKVQTIELINGSANLSLEKGLYVVRAGKATAKIML